MQKSEKQSKKKEEGTEGSHAQQNFTSCSELEFSESSNHEKHLQQYCQYLKQLRISAKPPIAGAATKARLCKQFDGSILKRTLKQLTKYIKSRQQRKQSEKAEHTQQFEDNSQWKCRKRTQTAHQAHQDNKHRGQHQQWVRIDRMVLCTWQLANIRAIIACSSSLESSLYGIPESIIHDFHRLCISTARVHISRWGLRHVTMQAMQITYFNLLKNNIIDSKPDQNGSLCCLIQAILSDTEGQQPIKQKDWNLGKVKVSHLGQEKTNEDPSRHELTKNQKKDNENQTIQNIPHESRGPIEDKTQSSWIRNIKNSEKSEKELACQDGCSKLEKKPSLELQLQWFIYILEYCMSHCEDFLKSTFVQLSNGTLHHLTRSAVTLLHFMSLLLNKIVGDRTTTELVKDHPSPIEDIRRMYTRNPNAEFALQSLSLDMRLSWTDYEWLNGLLLRQTFRHYKLELGRQLSHKLKSGTDPALIIKLPPYDPLYIQSIINCCNFLGGYNSPLQKKTTKMVIEFALQFLQLSFLIYELCHSKPRNIQIEKQSQIKKQYATNLICLLDVSQSQEKKTTQEGEIEKHIEQLKLEEWANLLPLEEGQLVGVVRLLSNLVHINEEAQIQIEQDLKYFRMVMGLTHQAQGQLTMKNWSIVFLRNVSERSPIMRSELEKLKITIKVDSTEFLPCI